MASQWQLMWWRFRKHKLALISIVVLIILYTLILFADFFAPYDPRLRTSARSLRPPQPIHFDRRRGAVSPAAFRLCLQGQMDPDTLRFTYTDDTVDAASHALLCARRPYKLWGLIRRTVISWGG